MKDLKLMTTQELCTQIKIDKELSLDKEVFNVIKLIRNNKGSYESSVEAKVYELDVILSKDVIDRLKELGYVYTEHTIEVDLGSEKRVSKTFLGIEYSYYYKYIPYIKPFKYYKVTACCGGET
jgi:hypothetical protein